MKTGITSKIALIVLAFMFISAAVPAQQAATSGKFAPAGPNAVIGYSVRSGGDDQLYRIDLTTGDAVALGTVGFNGVTALTFDGYGTLYGVDEVTDKLITIDIVTGAGTEVGPLPDIPGMVNPGAGLAYSFYNGYLYLTTDSGALYEVDPGSGAATYVGDMGMPVTGLADDYYVANSPASHLVMIGLGGDNTNELVEVDVSTAGIGDIGPLVKVSLSDGGIDFAPNGTLWGLDDTGDIFKIDTATGKADVVASTLSGFESLAISPIWGVRVVFRSVPGQDGYVVETSENSGMGGRVNSPSYFIRVGDANGDRQYKGFVSFDTSTLPNDAFVLMARVVLHSRGAVGTSPYNTHGALIVDARRGPYGSGYTLRSNDFQSTFSAPHVAEMSYPDFHGKSVGELNAAGRDMIQTNIDTQFRFAFALGDNDDGLADFERFMGGEGYASRPRLVVIYQAP